ncbi:hypothetical protein BGX34_007903 [Mortierella sp. NVP85]|nr:hypothetical protein BGX34_007903 [Mortierella sp. NVP85]
MADFAVFTFWDQSRDPATTGKKLYSYLLVSLCSHIISDELFSDSFPIKEVGVTLEIDCQTITIKKGAGDINIGANASAEGGDDEGADEEGTEQVNNVVFSNRLQATSFDKKSYTTYIKGYMKAIAAKIKETQGEAEEGTFKTGAAEAVKKILGNFKDYEFYIGESLNPEGAVMLLNYREDGVTPYFTVFKHGLKERKVVSV